MLRVISGTAKGHKLKTIKGMTTRPTTDRVKESLFNIIAREIADAIVLDLYAGTGSLGIEALSRGAAYAVFADRSSECASIIKENLIHTKLMHKADVLTLEAVNAISRFSREEKKFDVIFLDPPYSKDLIPETLSYIVDSGIIKDGGIIIAEKDASDEVPEQVGNLILFRNQKYGDTVLSFYRCQ